MKRILLASLCIIILLLPHVFAFTKSQEFVDATTTKEGKTGRVGISADQFAPKEPRFKKFVPPRIILGINVLTVAFGNFSEPPPILLSPKEFEEQKEAREKAAAEEKQEEKKEAPEEKEKPKNIRNALLSVKSARVPDQRVSVKAGSMLSLAIILIGLVAYSVIRFSGKKPV